MAKAIKGKIIDITPVFEELSLRVLCSIRTEEEEVLSAYLPDREISALLPRGILLGEDLRAGTPLLGSIKTILKRLISGRMVRIWFFEGRFYFSFLSWKNVRFTGEEEPAASGQILTEPPG